MLSSGAAASEPMAYRSAKTGLAWADLSDRDKIIVTGADCVKLLNNLSTNDLVKLPEGAGCELFLLDVKGRVFDYVVAYKLVESIWLDAEPGRGPRIVKHLDRYVIREDVKFSDATSRFRQAAVFGPAAAAALSELLAVDLCDWPNLRIATIPTKPGSVNVRRRDRSVLPGFDLLVATELWSIVEGLLEKLACPRLSADDVECLRIEAGLPRMGIDIEENCLAQEIDRNAQAISFTKGCYLGQETVARLDALGHVNRKLQGLVFDGAEPVSAGKKLLLADKPVGQVASSTYSPTLSAAIGIGMVRTAGVTSGATVSVESTGRKAIVRPFPLI